MPPTADSMVPYGVDISPTLDGPSAQILMAAESDPGVLRPYEAADGRPLITRNRLVNNQRTQEVMTANAMTGFPLPTQVYTLFDNAMLEGARPRRRLWADLVNAGCTLNIPDGLGVINIQHAIIRREGSTAISMDALRRSDRDRPTYDYATIPLPIIHSDFSFPNRELRVHARAGIPLDTSGAFVAGRAIMETVEKFVLGTLPVYTYAGGSIYGYLNYPGRNTTTVRNPSAYPSWTPSMLVDDMLAMMLILQNKFFMGPYQWYFGKSWLPYFGKDFSATFPGTTLSQRIRNIDGVGNISIADYLTGFRVLCVQMTPDVVQAVTGMPLSLVQWQGEGGWSRYWKAATIMVPRIRSDANGNCGIVDASPVSS